MQNRGVVTGRTFAEGSGGSIKVNASDIQIDGKFDNSLTAHSGFLPTAMGKGNMGEFVLSTRNLSLINGGYINASTLGSGNSAGAMIQADKILVDGVNQFGQSSLIAAGSFSSGNAGSVALNAREIILTNGGTVSTSTFANGKAGNVTLNTTESITVTGRLVPSAFSTTDGVSSSAGILPPGIQQLIGLPAQPSTDSGDVVITTNRLSITDGGEIKVNNQGIGNAGVVRVNAESIDLKNQGSINAATTAGGGGDITLNAQILLLRGQSSSGRDR